MFWPVCFQMFYVRQVWCGTRQGSAGRRSEYAWVVHGGRSLESSGRAYSFFVFGFASGVFHNFQSVNHMFGEITPSHETSNVCYWLIHLLSVFPTWKPGVDESEPKKLCSVMPVIYITALTGIFIVSFWMHGWNWHHWVFCLGFVLLWPRLVIFGKVTVEISDSGVPAFFCFFAVTKRCMCIVICQYQCRKMF